jgi:hypothetical protein
VNEKPSPDSGGFGNIGASAGSFTSDRSTGALRLKGPKKEIHKRTITIDNDLFALLVAERDRHLRIVAGIPDGPYLLVCSIARSIRSVFLETSISSHRSAKTSLRLAPVKASTATMGNSAEPLKPRTSACNCPSSSGSNPHDRADRLLTGNRAHDTAG